MSRSRRRSVRRRYSRLATWTAVGIVVLFAIAGGVRFLTVGSSLQDRAEQPAAASVAGGAAPSANSGSVTTPGGPSVVVGVPLPTVGDGEPLKRTVLALYNSATTPNIPDTVVHRVAEMPLNHLGLVVEYWDLAKGLPAASRLDHVHGVLAWLSNDDVPDAEAYYAWAESLVDAGLRYVVMGDVVRGTDAWQQSRSLASANRFYRSLGVWFTDDYVSPTYDVAVVDQDPAVASFERPFVGPLPPFDRFEARDRAVQSHLVLRRANDPATDSVAVATGPHGGLVVAGYALAQDRDGAFARWRVNPFAFFERAFGTAGLPKPDVTTLSGRRIYYSHIDGDGWRSLSTVDAYRDQGVIAADVVLRHAIAPYPDLPVTVAPIAADLDLSWLGTEEARRVARELFELPQVEAGSHTYSHPFDWGWFNRYQATAEIPFLRKYFPDDTPATLIQRLFGNTVRYEDVVARYPEATVGAASDRPLNHVYDTPRAYGHFPFSLTTEIVGATDAIGELLPAGKRVEVVQWSGNTSPFPEAIRATRDAGMRNLNGGDARFDPRYPSYTAVSPVGRQVGAERQIYASNSNENTYTKLWTDRFFGFQLLRQTVENTESPIRVKPFNVYYHMYSGEKQPALQALLANLDYARESELTPITTSAYAAVADGFYTARLFSIGENQWQIENRDGLQTVRFDDAGDRAVDFSRSQGVIGQRHYQGSLYVALDAAVAVPIVALRQRDDSVDREHLIHSRWSVRELRAGGDGFAFLAQGFGPGEMTWRVAPNGRYAVLAEAAGQPASQTMHQADANGVLQFTLEMPGTNQPVSIRVARVPVTEG